MGYFVNPSAPEGLVMPKPVPLGRTYMAGAMKAKAKEPEQQPQTKPDAAVGSELLAQAYEMIKHINHQNDHTRDWLRRCDEFMNPVASDDSTT